jgi:hypothetical protein
MALEIRILIFDPEVVRPTIEHDEPIYGIGMGVQGAHDPNLENKCREIANLIYNTIANDAIGQTVH